MHTVHGVDYFVEQEILWIASMRLMKFGHIINTQSHMAVVHYKFNNTHACIAQKSHQHTILMLKCLQPLGIQSCKGVMVYQGDLKI